MFPSLTAFGWKKLICAAGNALIILRSFGFRKVETSLSALKELMEERFDVFIGRFYTRGRIIRLGELGQTFVIRL